MWMAFRRGRRGGRVRRAGCGGWLGLRPESAVSDRSPRQPWPRICSAATWWEWPVALFAQKRKSFPGVAPAGDQPAFSEALTDVLDVFGRGS